MTPRFRVGLQRIVFTFGAMLAFSGSCMATAYAQAPDSDVLLLLNQHFSRSSHGRILTSGGLLEATGLRAGPEGITYRDITASTRPAALPVLGSLAWHAVLRVDTRENMAHQGAVGLGCGLGVIGLLLGLAAGIASTSNEAGTYALEGAAIGVASGAVLGAAIGSIRHKWVQRYPSPTSKAAARK